MSTARSGVNARTSPHPSAKKISSSCLTGGRDSYKSRFATPKVMHDAVNTLLPGWRSRPHSAALRRRDSCARVSCEFRFHRRSTRSARHACGVSRATIFLCRLASPDRPTVPDQADRTGASFLGTVERSPRTAERSHHAVESFRHTVEPSPHAGEPLRRTGERLHHTGESPHHTVEPFHRTGECSHRDRPGALVTISILI